jgi:hypothetical protein
MRKSILYFNYIFLGSSRRDQFILASCFTLSGIHLIEPYMTFRELSPLPPSGSWLSLYSQKAVATVGIEATNRPFPE